MSTKPILSETPTKEEMEVVDSGLGAFNINAVGGKYQRVDLVFKTEDGTVMGGLFGSTYWGWGEVKILWVDEQFRGQDLGSKLMKRFEEIAKTHDCKSILLDTFSFQAPEFYEKLGYQTFGKISNIPGDHERIYYEKKL